VKNKGKLKFFIVFALILTLTFTAFAGLKYQYGDNVTAYIKGFDDIRWGIDLNGGSKATLTPAGSATEDQVKEAEAVIKLRLSDLDITDYSVTTDMASKEITVCVPDENAGGLTADDIFAEVSATGKITFVKGDDVDDDGKPTGEVILTGEHIVSAEPMYTQSGSTPTYGVTITFDEEGTKLFAAATKELAENEGVITVWRDNSYVTGASVGVEITDGIVSLTGSTFTSESVSSLAERITTGALPYDVKAYEVTAAEATLGSDAKNAVLISLAAAAILVCVAMVVLYRVPGAVSCIALLGQIAGIVMVATGYIGSNEAFTMTLPALLGVGLAVILGIAGNIIVAQGLKDQLLAGKGLHVGMKNALSNGFSTIINYSVMAIAAAVVMMAAFSPVNNVFVTLLSPIMFFFKAEANAAIYSFGYMLFAGTILSLIFNTLAYRIMLKAVSTVKGLDNNALYGGAKNAQ